MGDESPQFFEDRSKEQNGRWQGGLLTLLFTDIVGSTSLKERLGDRVGVARIQEHHAAVRNLLNRFPGGAEIETGGDSFLLVFATPSEAVRFALLLQKLLREFNQSRAEPVQDRIGLHMGEVVLEEREGKRDVHGIQVDTCARVMSLAQAGQILMTRPVFDNGRQSLKGEEIEGVGALEWLNHGRFELKGVGEPVEVCEVRAAGTPALSPPTTSEKARRVEAAEGEAVLGWRPAVGNTVPNTQWRLEQKLGEGGFGEVWLGQHQVMKERRVFKFCFRADRVRSLKREMTLFRLIKERIGDHPNIVSLREVYFEHPPYYVEEDYVEGQDLLTWCRVQGGAEKVSLKTKLEIVAQIADGLQAAHDAGVIHRDVKPANILVCRSSRREEADFDLGSLDANRSEPPRVGCYEIQAKLTDFGIGQVISQEALAGVTKAGFTQTMLSSSSSQTGTHLYMAPELLAGKPASTRSDIYSLGVVLYQLLIGDVNRPLITDWQDAITEPLLREDLQHCFAGDPQNRFAAASLLARNLRELQPRRARQAEAEESRRHALRRRFGFRVALGTATVLLMLAAVLLYGLKRAQSETLKARRIAYTSDMNVAWAALRDNNLQRVEFLLQAQIPEKGQPDLRHWEWRYLWQQSRGEQVWTLGPIGKVALGLAVLPGERLAIGGGGAGGPGEPLHIWDLERQEVLRTSNFKGNISGMAATPDGRRLAVATWDQTVRILDSETLDLVGEFKHSKSIWRVAISPKGDFLSAVGSEDLSVWDLATLSLVWAVETPNNLCEAPFLPDGESLVVSQAAAVGCARFGTRDGRAIWRDSKLVNACMATSPDGQTVAGGGWLGALVLLEASSGLSRELTNYSQPITSVVFSHDGRYLAAAGVDRIVRLWDLQLGRETSSFRGHRNRIIKMAFSETDRHLFTASEDGTVRGWDAKPQSLPGAEVPDAASEWAQTDLGIFGVKPISRDARWVATRETNLVRRIVSLETFREIGTAHLPANSAAFALSLDGMQAACGGTNGEVELWNLRSGEVSWKFAAHSNRIDALEFSPGGDYIATAGRGAEVRYWRCRGSETEFTRVLANGRGRVRDMIFTWDGKTLIVPAYGAIHLISLAPGGGTREIQVGDEIYCLDVSRDGSLLAAGGEHVTVWDLKSLRLVLDLHGSLGVFTGTVSFSPDQRRLLASDNTWVSWLWDLPTGREVGRFGLSERSYAHFLPDGDTIVLSKLRPEAALRDKSWGGLTFLHARTWAQIFQTEKEQEATRERWKTLRQ